MTKPILESLEAEQAVLGGLLLSNAALAEIDTALDAADFTRPAYAKLYRTLVDLINAGQPADEVTAAQASGLAMADLLALSSSVPSARHIRRYADIVRSAAQRRRLAAALDDAAEAARRLPSSAAVLDAVSAAVAPFHAVAGGNRPERLGEIAIRRTEFYEQLAAGAVAPGWPTGLPKLDRILSGGLREGRVYVLAARPGIGKSSLALWLTAKVASQGLPALVLSQEMAREELADRAVSFSGRIDYGNLQRGELADEDWARAADALDALAKLPIYVDDQGALTLAQIKAKSRQVPGLKLLVVDYLQLCDGGDGENANERVGELSKGMKALARELGVAVLLLSQLNRGVEDRAIQRPTLRDLRDSGAIEQDADVVFFLWPHHTGCRALTVSKQRNGATGDIAMHFEGATQRWGEAAIEIHDEPPTRGRRRHAEL